jgi:hypothetical protein
VSTDKDYWGLGGGRVKKYFVENNGGWSCGAIYMVTVSVILGD